MIVSAGAVADIVVVDVVVIIYTLYLLFAVGGFYLPVW